MGGTAVKKLLALALFALLAAGLAACGGSGDSGSTQSTPASSAPGTTTTPPSDDSGANQKQAGDGKGGSAAGGHAGAPAGSGSKSGSGSGSKSGSGGSSAEFRTPGGDNSIQTYGTEADSEELAEAEAAVVAYLDARARGDWEKSCEYLAKIAREPLEKLAASSPQLKGKKCGAVIALLSGRLPKAALASPLVEGIAAVRFKGDRGFALFHGPKGADFFISLVREGGQWKVGSLAPSEFP